MRLIDGRGRHSSLGGAEREGVTVKSADDLYVELVGDVDIPGWVFIPEDLSLAEQELWLTEVTTALCDYIRAAEPQQSGALESEVRSVLEAGLVARARSDSYLMYQVWPVAAPAATMCHVNLAASEDIPWSQMEGTFHEAHAQYVGPGTQFSRHDVIESEYGSLEVVAVHFIFDDGDTALMMHLEESLSSLISPSLVRFAVFKDSVRVVRGDGRYFASRPRPGVVADEVWPDED